MFLKIKDTKILSFLVEHYPIKMDTNQYSVHQWSWRLGFNPRSSYTKDSKIVLDAALLNTQHYKVRIKVKVRESPISRCSSY